MPSDNKKAKAAAKKLGGKKRANGANKKEETVEIIKPIDQKVAITNGDNNNHDQKPSKHELDEEFMGSEDEDDAKAAALIKEIESMNLCNEAVAQYRSVTGVLSSQKESRDIHFGSLCVTFHGQEILQDTSIELNNGRRYGLIGLNGCGKSTLFAVLANNELSVPSHIDHYLLQREMGPSDKTALESVIEADDERMRLEEEAEHLALLDDVESQDRLVEVYERLDDLDVERAEKRAAEILFGLGFTKDMQNKAVKHFSGGWRMRISLARALFIRPALLMLDEPTNHLDLNACVWLEKELSKYNRILIIISHSEDFLNGVCTNIIHMHNKKLNYYTGNYDQYNMTKMELEENQMKKYKWEQDQIAHMKDYIARFGHGSRKLARQAQSKEKTLKKMVDNGLTQKVTGDKNLVFSFPSCGEIPPPVIQIQNVSFRYGDNKPLIYDNIDFGVDLDTRVALVGPNGAGKSTLLKLIASELEPTDGLIRRHSHCRIGRYHQHLHEILDLNVTAIEWMMAKFPAIKERDDMRKKLGRYGLTGAQQSCPIKALSDGQRCRIIFAWLAEGTPHMLLLDEPTNHLDLETIDSLADALNAFEGGLLLVSHDFRLIGRVAEEIWVCDHGKVTKWAGDIYGYKEALTRQIEKEHSAAMLTER